MRELILSKIVLFPSFLLIVFISSLLFFVNLREGILAKKKALPKEDSYFNASENKVLTNNIASPKVDKRVNLIDYEGFSVIETGKALGISTSQKKDVEVSSAKIKEGADDIKYFYEVRFSDSAFNRVKNGYRYKVDTKNCIDYRIYKTVSSFTGVRKTDVSKTFNIQATIYKNFVEEINGTENSTIEILDLNNLKLFEGKIKVPKCFKLEESNSTGKFSIPKPIVNGELDGKTQFIYTFNIDENALEKLDEEGFKYKIQTSCANRVNPDDNYFEKTVAEGEAYGYSFDVTIEDKFLPSDEDKKLKLALYEVKAINDEALFRGLTYAPDCN